MYKFKGTIKEIKDTVTFNKGFQKREFVLIETESKFPQIIKFDLFKENTELINNYAIGDEIEVKFNLKGREYNNNYYITLEAYAIIFIKQNNYSVVNNLDDNQNLPF